MKYQMTDRQLIEERYHDEVQRSGVIQRGHLSTGQSTFFKHFYELIGIVKGLHILEVGCGCGWFGLQLAQQDANVLGIDISGELVRQASREAENQGCTGKVVFQKMAVEHMSFKGNSFDLVVGNAILHHTDISVTITNVHRVLIPGGRAIFVEPLNENIVLKIWRVLTPWRRSKTERALVKQDLEYIKTVFSSAAFYYFGLTSMISMGLLMYFPRNKMLGMINEKLERCDKILSTKYPQLGQYYAVVVMDLKK